MTTIKIMTINKVNIYKILIPLSGEFPHSKKRGVFVKNVISEVICNGGGIRGYGEGAPRTYVTGESQESVFENIKMLIHKDLFPWELSEIKQIWDFIDSLPSTKKYNSAVCALEMSLLDALGQIQKKSISEYFNKDFITDKIRYSGTIPLGNQIRRLEICKLMKRLDINRLRIKMGTNIVENINAIDEVKEFFDNNCDIRIDANGGWDSEIALRHVQPIIDKGIKVVEQPLTPGDTGIYEFYKKICTYNIMIMADESVCTKRDLEKVINDGYFGMVNIRLSKCGGFRRSMSMIEYLRKNGLSFQVGCQLGETGILSAAGRVLSLLSSDALYHDGSYDKYLLRENLTYEDVSFGNGGYAGPINGPGLGVRINPEKLRHMTDHTPVTSIPKP